LPKKETAKEKIEDWFYFSLTVQILAGSVKS